MAEIPAEAVRAVIEGIDHESIERTGLDRPAIHAVLRIAAPFLAGQARAVERALVVAYIRDYFSAVDDDLYDDVKTLCGRIERGNHLPAPETFGTLHPPQSSESVSALPATHGHAGTPPNPPSTRTSPHMSDTDHTRNPRNENN